MLKLFLAFTLVPALEIYLFVKIGGAIGVLNTLLVVLLTGFAGAADLAPIADVVLADIGHIPGWLTG